MNSNDKTEMPGAGSKAAGSRFFPVFIDLSEKKIIVVGGGTIAERRVKTLLDFAGSILVISPSATDLLRRLSDEGRIEWKQTAYDRGLIQDADMVLACTDDEKVNGDIHAACRCLGIPVNCSNDRHRCDFYFPGIVRKDNVVIGITASGTDHRRAKEVRQLVEKALGEEKE